MGQTTINIETENTILSLHKATDGQLLSTYFGRRLTNPAEYAGIPALDKFKPGNDDLYNQRLAYVTSGSTNLLEPALSVTHADGNNSLFLQYVNHWTEHIDSNQTITKIELSDPRYKFLVFLFYKVYKREDIIEQWTEI